MIHIATVHYRSDRWIDIQANYLRRFVRVPFQTWANLEGVEHRAPAFDHVVKGIDRHEGKLNLLAAEISTVAAPEDLIMFLDGDAFPIDDPMPTISVALADADLVAVRRAENADEPQPHPCFAVASVKTWLEINGDWSPGYPWEWHPEGGWGEHEPRVITDVWGNLLHLLELHGKTWYPLLRTNRVNQHPLWYAIYGGIIYHHGAGFRPEAAVGRWDWQHRPTFRLARCAKHPLIGPVVRRFNFEYASYWGQADSAEESS